MGDNTTAALIFQFHKGTIRTKASALRLRKVLRFQFHKGTIRTSLFEESSRINEISIP